MIRFVLMTFALLFCHTAFAEQLLSSLDREQINDGETITLTIKRLEGGLFSRPDTAALEEHFELVDSQQVNERITQGQSSTQTVWRFVLKPKRLGTQQIPAISFGSQDISQPLELTVNPARTVRHSDQPILIETELDASRVYLQSQVLLTVRVYHRVPMYDNGQFIAPQISNVLIERLGNNKAYEQTLDGVRYGVIEARYALYPQHSGEVLLPAVRFSGAAALNPKQPPEPVNLMGQEAVLRVLPIPEEYPLNVPWLPATDVQLSQHWTPDTGQWRVGEPVTRTLILQADGITAAQLPAIQTIEASGFRRYPDQPVLTTDTQSGLPIARREQREALIPTRSGALLINAVQVTWWNTRTHQVEQAKLPAGEVNISPVASALSAPNTIVIDHKDKVYFWRYVSAALAVSTLLFVVLWLRARRRPAIIRAPSSEGQTQKALLDDLRKACQNHNPQGARQALDAWARTQPESVSEMAVRYSVLADALDDLNAALYSAQGQIWQGETLWDAISTLPDLNAQAGANSLPPLYPR